MHSYWNEQEKLEYIVDHMRALIALTKAGFQSESLQLITYLFEMALIEATQQSDHSLMRSSGETVHHNSGPMSGP